MNKKKFLILIVLTIFCVGMCLSSASATKTKHVTFSKVKNIKGSHFDLGDMKNDFGTTVSNAYQYDPKAAREAKANNGITKLIFFIFTITTI